MPDTHWIEAARHVVEHGFTVVREDGTFGPPTEAEWRALEEADGDDAPEPTGGVILDRFTASMLVQVYDGLRPENRERFAGLDLFRAVTVGWRLVK